MLESNVGNYSIMANSGCIYSTYRSMNWELIFFYLENQCTSNVISGARYNIPDTALSASSSIHGFGANESRLSLLRESVGWTALSTDESPWIMADLGKLMPIYKVRTLGNLDGNAWVTSYMICKKYLWGGYNFENMYLY